MTEKERAALQRQKQEVETKRNELKLKVNEKRSTITESELSEAERQIREYSSNISTIEGILQMQSEQQREFPEKEQITAVNFRKSTEYRDAFYRSVASNKINERDADVMKYGRREVTNMDGDGAKSGAQYLVPTTTIDGIISIMAEYGAVYNAIPKFNFNGSVSLPIGNMNEGENEEGIRILDFDFTEVKLTQEAKIATVTIKNLLLKNSIAALESFIVRELGKWLAIKLDLAVIYGDESEGGSFVGIMEKVTAKKYTKLDFSFVCEIFASIKGFYQRRGVFIMSSQTFWGEFMSMAEEARTILGVTAPIFTFVNGTWYLLQNQIIFTDAMEIGDFIFGALKDNYVINESQEIVIESDTSNAFNKDKTVWKGKIYAGGAPVLANEAFVVFVKDGDKVVAPTATPTDGAVAANSTITLDSETVKATIYFTLDGSVPTKASSKYSLKNKPEIKEECTLKAVAIKSGMQDSTIMSASYTIG